MKNSISFVMFLVICILAFSFQDFNLFESSSESMKVLLGTPPPEFLVSISLAIYCFSAGITTLMNIVNNVKPKFKISHLGYRTSFFVFYCFSGAIAINFIPVVVVGVCLYSLEYIHNILYSFKIESLNLFNH